MVRLSNVQSASSSLEWESAEIDYVNNPSIGQTITLNHNFGAYPDIVECYAHDTISDTWYQIDDQFSTGGTAYGAHSITPTDVNNSRVTLWQLNILSYSTDIDKVKFKCFKLGVSAGSVAAFKWSASEQVWPFEKAADGSTLYCVEVDMGTVNPNSTKQVAHDISDLDIAKVYKIDGMRLVVDSYTSPLPWPWVDPSAATCLYVTSSNAVVVQAGNANTVNCKVRIIYAK